MPCPRTSASGTLPAMAAIGAAAATTRKTTLRVESSRLDFTVGWGPRLCCVAMWTLLAGPADEVWGAYTNNWSYDQIQRSIDQKLMGRARIAAMNASEPTPRARRGRPPRTTPDELVGAAMAVISREGVGAATTRKIAEEAGVPLGTVHYWFKDKSELLEEVVREMVRRIERATEEFRLSGDAHVKDALLAAFREIAADDLGAQLGIYELTALAIRTPGMRELASRQYGLYRETARRALGPVLGDLALDEHELGALAELVAVTFDGMILAWLADPVRSNPEAVFGLLAELIEVRLSSTANRYDVPVSR